MTYRTRNDIFFNFPWQNIVTRKHPISGGEIVPSSDDKYLQDQDILYFYRHHYQSDAYVFCVHDQSQQTPFPFSATQLDTLENVPPQLKDLPAKSFMFYDDINTSAEKILTVVCLKDVDNSDLITKQSDEIKDGLMALNFSQTEIAETMGKTHALYWTIHTKASEPTLYSPQNLPEDGHGTAGGKT